MDEGRQEAEAVQRERERCAKVAERAARRWPDSELLRLVLKSVAAEIREGRPE